MPISDNNKTIQENKRLFFQNTKANVTLSESHLIYYLDDKVNDDLLQHTGQRKAFPSIRTSLGVVKFLSSLFLFTGQNPNNSKPRHCGVVAGRQNSVFVLSGQCKQQHTVRLHWRF